ncbi:hypothetical protein EMCRGX_G018982 [Ephydatia muelleri]
MGGVISYPIRKVKSVMDENVKKSQEFMLASQQLQMERQIQMQLLMRERMVATQLAVAREAMYWWGGFYSLCLVGLTAGFLKTKKPGVIVPIVPLSFVVGYQADMAFGNKMERIVAEADRILKEEQHLLSMPGAPMTFKLVDESTPKAR